MRCLTTIVSISSIFSNIITSVLIRNGDRFHSWLNSFLFLSLFPCHHTRRLPLIGWSRSFSGSPLDLTLTAEGIHWPLPWIVLLSQPFFVGLEKLVVLLSLENHALMELRLELIHSSSRCIYHIRIFLLRVVIQLLLILVLVHLFLLHLTNQHWIGLRLQLSLFEYFVIS